MAKYKVYLRIASGGRDGYKVDASTKPNYTPIIKDQWSKTFRPTVAFAVNFDVPDELFRQAERVIADLDVKMKEAKVTGEMLVPLVREAQKLEKNKKSAQIIKDL